MTKKSKSKIREAQTREGQTRKAQTHKADIILEPKLGAVEHQIRVLCVDDNADMTLMMKMLIDAEPAMRFVGSLTSAGELLRTVDASDEHPNVVLLDSRMPGADPMQVMKAMAAEHPEICTIIVSGYDRQEFIIEAINHGAWGFISKRLEPEEIVQAIRLVAAGTPCFPTLRS